MDNTVKGIGAGLIASIVLLALIYVKQVSGIFPDLDSVQLMTSAFHRIGAPLTPATGWISLLAIGTILWGGLFGTFNHFLPGKTELVKGLWLSIFAWLVMMLVWMPMANVGVFASALGWTTAAVTLVLHLIFGVVLGASYASLIHVKALKPVLH